MKITPAKFRLIVRDPVLSLWGQGWHRLSEDQKRAELQAQCWRVIQNSARLNSPDNDLDMAALGRFVAGLERALRDHFGEGGDTP